MLSLLLPMVINLGHQSIYDTCVIYVDFLKKAPSKKIAAADLFRPKTRSRSTLRGEETKFLDSWRNSELGKCISRLPTLRCEKVIFLA